MATMIKCDCCGKEKNYKVSSPAYYILDVTRDTNRQHHVLNVDICEGCYEVIMHVINGGNNDGE